MRQYFRIEANADGARLDRAAKTAARYVANIKKTKSYKAIRGNSEDQSLDDYFSNLRKARNMQYSQNTYMGINVG